MRGGLQVSRLLGNRTSAASSGIAPWILYFWLIGAVDMQRGIGLRGNIDQDVLRTRPRGPRAARLFAGWPPLC